MSIPSQPQHSIYSENKKQREYELISHFLKLCPDFLGYSFLEYSENPDMIFQNGSKKIGFDSVIISDDKASADCYFDSGMCKICIPTKLNDAERTEKITIFFENKLFKHFRRYSLPTVLVFSLVDTSPTTFSQITSIARRFELPEFSMFNISDYYICDKSKYVKISETKLTNR